MPGGYLDKITRFGGQYRDYMQRSFSRYEMTPNEIAVLVFLFVHAPVLDSASDIARGCGVSKALVTRSVVSLTHRGFIAPRRSQDDRRIVHLALTEKSRELGRELDLKQREFNRQLIAGVSPEDMDAVGRVLDVVEKNMLVLLQNQK